MTTMAHKMFVLTLVSKAILGLLQLGTAVALILGFADHLPALVQWLFKAELAENPTDFLANKVISLVGVLPQTDLTFYKVYFTAHGVLHLGVVAALLYGASWAYHVGVGVLVVFVIYQIFEWFHVGGLMLVVLTIIDVLVIYLTVLEHGRSRRPG